MKKILLTAMIIAGTSLGFANTQSGIDVKSTSRILE